MKKHWLALIVMVYICTQLSCFTVSEDLFLEGDQIRKEKKVDVPTQIHLVDASYISADKGFSVVGDTVVTDGALVRVGFEPAPRRQWRVPIDSIAGVAYTDNVVTPGSFIVGTLGVIGITAGVVVLAVAIFGSCPTVYAVVDTAEILQAECFSHSIGRQFERSDLDKLNVGGASQGSLSLRIRNEALETHYINSLALGIVEHPLGTQAYSTSDDGIVIVRNIVEPVAAQDSKGRSILPSLQRRDGVSYQTDSALTKAMLIGNEMDCIELAVYNPSRSSNATVLLRVRNTLQATVLFYDIMLRDQGPHALEMIEALNSDPFYSWNLGRWYKEVSGIRISVMQDGDAEFQSKIYDAGPIAWKDVASSFTVDNTTDTLRIQLSMQPDYWAIDWVGFSFDGSEPVSFRFAGCSSIRSSTGQRLLQAEKAVQMADDDYTITNPGDWFDVEFDTTPRQNMMQTYFLHSQGYYIEWVRGSWLRQDKPMHVFKPSWNKELRDRLATAWLTKKNNFEGEFFQQRVRPSGVDR